MVSYFKRNKIRCENIINKWSGKYFNSRKKVFDECVWAIRKKKYYSAIPTLLIQIEGIIRNIHLDKDDEEKYNRDHTNSKGYTKYWNVKDYVSGNYLNWDKVLKDIIINDIFCKFDESYLNTDTYKSNTNRNEILHGININYNYPSVLWKIVLILDFIYSIYKKDSANNYKKKVIQ